GMKLMLDGVFNHIGRRSDIFLEALQNANDPHRNWFFFGDEFKNGYRSFANVQNMPAWKLENPQVRDYLWNGRDSVVKHWLKKGADGWRLDVAFELGPDYLQELTNAAHRQKPGSPVVGEVSGYPADWYPQLDGTFNFFPIDLGKNMLKGNLEGGRVGQMLDDMVADAPYENLLKSWLLTDNHDTPRLAYQCPDIEDRKILEAMQFTLPGSPVIYYGTELGMDGGGDPACRAPMRWDLVTSNNKDLAWVKQMVALRKANPALRYGDFKALRTNKLLAYLRTTDQLRQSVMVVVNPTDQAVTETFAVRIGRLMSWGEMKDAMGGQSIRAIAGQATVTMKPKSVCVFNVVDSTDMGYSQYSRIK
ncbi:MAG: alpha-amylase family glycosyl hydrolase, partial [bacterium]